LEDVLDVRDLRHAALSHEQLGRHSVVAGLAKRRVVSLMYSCTPQISEMTSTIGWPEPLAGRASYIGTLTPPTGTVWSPATNPSVSVLIAWASTVSTLIA